MEPMSKLQHYGTLTLGVMFIVIMMVMAMILAEGDSFLAIGIMSMAFFMLCAA